MENNKPKIWTGTEIFKVMYNGDHKESGLPDQFVAYEEYEKLEKKAQDLEDRAYIDEMGGL